MCLVRLLGKGKKREKGDPNVNNGDGGEES
jgi:hypothetical protein